MMIRRRLTRVQLAAALAVAAGAWAPAPRVMAFEQSATAAKPASPAEEVTAQVRRYFEAVKRNDAATLDGLLAPDYVEVSPLGQVDKRAQVIEFYRVAARAQTGQASELADVSIDELSVRLFGATAVAVVGEAFKLMIGGKPVVRSMRSTLVWHRADGAWKLVSSHHTTIRPPIGSGDSMIR